jgi:hypothetical protein
MSFTNLDILWCGGSERVVVLRDASKECRVHSAELREVFKNG